MTDETGYQMSFADLGLWSGKMSAAHSVRELPKGETSKPSSQKSAKSQSQTLPMCLCLIGGGGAKPDASTMRWEDGQLLGEYTMPSFGEQPKRLMEECMIGERRNGVSVSHLSQILVEDAPQKYYLSEKACIGILNRANKRGKELPEVLRKALETQANLSNSDSEG